MSNVSEAMERRAKIVNEMLDKLKTTGFEIFVVNLEDKMFFHIGFRNFLGEKTLIELDGAQALKLANTIQDLFDKNINS